jgi:peptidoglycan/xylan/chitin deacetylase (PgdA/CDA1 family)
VGEEVGNVPRLTSWFRQVARRTLAAVLPRRAYLIRGARRSQTVCLTFDDGPHPELTPRLLDLLAELNVPATFFLIGREVEKYPDVVRRIVANGHAVGNHSYSHPPRETLTSGAAATEVRLGSEAIARIVGKPPTLFRPPRGQVTARDLWRLWRGGLTTVLWNVDPKDYNKSSAGDVRDWFRGRDLEGGDLVLFHDTHPLALEVLPDLVASARDRGLEFTTVEAWTK